MPTMVCVPCQRFFKVERNGVTFEEGFGDGQRRPYKMWMADLYQCPGCKTRVVAGLGRGPVAEHYMPEYDRLRERFQPSLFVDDCPGGAIHPEPVVSSAVGSGDSDGEARDPQGASGPTGC